jgi:hypothetical protein
MTGIGNKVHEYVRFHQKVVHGLKHTKCLDCISLSLSFTLMAHDPRVCTWAGGSKQSKQCGPIYYLIKV